MASGVGLSRHLAHGFARDGAYTTGAFLLVVATAVILTALGFEYIGQYIPCPLCLQERYAYYAGIPLTFMALVLYSSGYRTIAGLLFALVALMFFVNAGLGGYHAGAEWKFWPGPSTCGTVQAIGGSGGGILDRLPQTKVIKCDEAQWRFAMLSFAGWNAVISVLLFGAGAKAAWACASRSRP